MKNGQDEDLYLDHFDSESGERVSDYRLHVCRSSWTCSYCAMTRSGDICDGCGAPRANSALAIDPFKEVEAALSLRRSGIDPGPMPQPQGFKEEAHIEYGRLILWLLQMGVSLLISVLLISEILGTG